MGWVVVKHITSDKDLDYREWVNLEKKNPQLLPNDGFYASVQFYSLKTNSMTDLNRGDAMTVNYKGLERIMYRKEENRMQQHRFTAMAGVVLL